VRVVAIEKRNPMEKNQHDCGTKDVKAHKLSKMKPRPVEKNKICPRSFRNPQENSKK
jgi:hypothetical protein